MAGLETLDLPPTNHGSFANFATDIWKAWPTASVYRLILTPRSESACFVTTEESNHFLKTPTLIDYAVNEAKVRN
jgi:hypothetical protein